MRCVIATTRGLGVSSKNFESFILLHVRGTSKIKFKKVIKKIEYLKASIADLITLLSSSVQNYEGGGDGGDSCADPCQEFKHCFLGVSSGLSLV
jgi:hypothetical protein